MSDRHGGGSRAPAGRHRHRRAERWRIRQVDLLGAICADAADAVSSAGRSRKKPTRSSAAPTAPALPNSTTNSTASESVATVTEAICTGPIAYTGQAELQRDIDNFKAALGKVKTEEAFLPVAAPASVIPDRKNEYYKNDEELQAAIGNAMRTEYKMIIDAGLLVQLDDARSAVTYDRMVPPGDLRRLQALARKADRNHEPRHRRHSGRPHPLSRLLGFVAGPACHRRAAQGHCRHDPEGEGRGFCD